MSNNWAAKQLVRGVPIRGRAQKGAPCAKGGAMTFLVKISAQMLSDMNQVVDLSLAMSGSPHSTF